MAALETFEWLVETMVPFPDAMIKEFLEEQRRYFLAIRNENDRELFLDELMNLLRHMKKQKPGSAS